MLFVREGLGFLMTRATQIDALFEIDRTTERLVVGRIARRDALHAACGIAMTIGAGLAGRALLLLPQRFAVEHPEHAGVGRLVVLHRPGFRRHEGVAGPALSSRDFGRDQGTGDNAGCNQQRRQNYRRGELHSTVMLADAVSEKPLSPIHSKSNFPLFVATVKKEKNGLAAVAGKRSARKICSPSKRQVK